MRGFPGLRPVGQHDARQPAGPGGMGAAGVADGGRAGDLPEALVLSDGLATAQVGLDGSLFLGMSFASFSHDDPHLGVGSCHSLLHVFGVVYWLSSTSWWAFLIVIRG